MEDKIAAALGDSTDYWASPTTQVFAFIGLFWLSIKIFSFWRLIASLFILPGTSVSATMPYPSYSTLLTFTLAAAHKVRQERHLGSHHGCQ